MSGYVEAVLVSADGTKPVGIIGNPLIVDQSGATTVAIQSVTGTEAAAGDSVIVAGVAGKKIRVFALSLFAPSATTAVTIKFTDGPGGAVLYTAIVQAPNQASFSFAAGVSIPTFLFGTSPGNALVMNVSAAVASIAANISYWAQ